MHLNQHLGLSSLVDAAKIEARIQSELGKTVQKVLTQKGSKGAADLSAQDRAQLLHSHSRRHRIGQCTRVSLRVPARFAHDPSRFTLWRYAMVRFFCWCCLSATLSFVCMGWHDLPMRALLCVETPYVCKYTSMLCCLLLIL